MLPISSKDFGKLVFDAIFEFMIENNLLSSTQSGFKPNDSCVHQLISITHSIFSAFDGNPSLEVRDRKQPGNPSLEVRGVFLNLSKAFERV